MLDWKPFNPIAEVYFWHDVRSNAQNKLVLIQEFNDFTDMFWKYIRRLTTR